MKTINISELYDDMHEQAQTALSFLDYTHKVEVGESHDPGDSPSHNRDLTKDEGEVKESALSCLLSYFMRELSTKEPTQLSTMFVEKVDTKKHVKVPRKQKLISLPRKE